MGSKELFHMWAKKTPHKNINTGIILLDKNFSVEVCEDIGWGGWYNITKLIIIIGITSTFITWTKI